MTLIASKRSASSIRTIVLRNENKNRTQYSIIEHHHPSLGGRGVVGSGRKCQTACKPGSVPPEGGDGHSSGPLIAERFSRPTRTPRAGEPCTRRRATSLFGLAPGGACHAVPVARSAVGPYPTLSPLPLPKRRRFAFCGAIPRVTPGGRYPPPFRRGARTFLDAETPRPPDRLTANLMRAHIACVNPLWLLVAKPIGAPAKSQSHSHHRQGTPEVADRHIKRWSMPSATDRD